MDEINGIPAEETLDPDDWEAMRALGHRMLDDALDYVKNLREQPVWRHAPQQVKEHFAGPLPLAAGSPGEVYEEYLQYIRPYQLGSCHPRFWGWIAGTGTVMGMFAEMLAASTDSVSGSFSFCANNYVELQVLDWCKKMLGYPAGSSGVLTSGCSASNLIGLAVARNSRAGFDARAEGMQGAPERMTVYCSQEAHSSIQKAVELLGFGSASLRCIPVDGAMRIQLPALREAIAADRTRGWRPLCAVGVAGTTNTGNVDDLNALADLCQEEDLWFHVDGAFGAWAAIAPGYKHLVSGLERADSLAFDLHKWMYLSYPIACVLIKDSGAHRRAFSLTPAYLAHGEGESGLTGIDVPWLSDLGIELSRGCAALKAWMTIKEQGAEKYGRLIQQNIQQAHYVAALAEAAPELELALPPVLNVVCFRYARPELDEAELDRLNKRIEIELQEEGIAVPSIVTINGKKYLHAAMTNHRTRQEDLDMLIHETIRLGNVLA